MEHFCICLSPSKATASAIGAIRRVLAVPISTIRGCVTTGGALLQVDVHHNTYVEDLGRGIALLAVLDAHGVEAHLVIDGEPEPLEMLQRALDMWDELGEQFERLGELGHR